MLIQGASGSAAGPVWLYGIAVGVVHGGSRLRAQHELSAVRMDLRSAGPGGARLLEGMPTTHDPGATLLFDVALGLPGRCAGRRSGGWAGCYRSGCCVALKLVSLASGSDRATADRQCGRDRDCHTLPAAVGALGCARLPLSRHDRPSDWPDPC